MMGSATGNNVGSQAGQQFSGSQAGQGTSNDGQQQQQQNGTGSQVGQGQQGQQQQQEPLELPGMLAGESVKDYAERIHGALQTARKQAASYRTRLASTGLSADDDDDGTGSSGSQAGQSQTKNQQSSENDRLARLEKALADERAARRTDRITSQLTSALAKEGALNPDRALRLIDVNELNVSDDGTIDDPLGAVRELRASDPYLFGDKRGSADGGAGHGSEPSNDINAMIRARARKN